MEKIIKRRGDEKIQNPLKQTNQLDRNLENFRTITNITENEVFLHKADQIKIKVILQEDLKNSALMENNILSCSILLNLLHRFIPNIKFEGNMNYIKKLFPFPSFLSKLNKNRFKTTITIVVGQRKIPAKNVYYISSSGWSIFISKNNPCKWKNYVYNPLSALFIGALMTGEIYKLLMREFIKVDLFDEFFYDFISHGESDQPVSIPSLPKKLDIDISMIGCGAVGQAIGLALNFFELKGKIAFVDDEMIDLSNCQRYPLAFKEHIGQPKTQLLSIFLLTGNIFLMGYEILQQYQQTISAELKGTHLNDVFISVDNKRTRIDLQASLPKMIWNVWTDTGANTLRYGVGKHDFADPYECLACSYYPEGGIPSQIELNSKILGITKEEIKEKINNQDLIEEEDLEYIFANFTIPQNQVPRIKSLIGRPFKEILHGECGVFNVKLLEKHEPSPAPHVPTLAGVYSVIQYVLSRIIPENPNIVNSAAEFDAFSYPNKNCLIKKKKNENCVCNDRIYQSVFKKKWENK